MNATLPPYCNFFFFYPNSRQGRPSRPYASVLLWYQRVKQGRGGGKMQGRAHNHVPVPWYAVGTCPRGRDVPSPAKAACNLLILLENGRAGREGRGGEGVKGETSFFLHDGSEKG